MSKKKVLEKQPEILSTEFTVKGPFVLAHVEDASGKKAIGISKHSKSEKYNLKKGHLIAFGRAKKALTLKLNGYEVNHNYMG